MPPGLDRRTRGRVLQQGVISNVGVVIDISGGGMRVLHTKPLEGQHEVEITTESETLKLVAQVVWCKKIGFRRQMAGLRFVNIDEATVRSIARIAAAHRLNK